MPGGDLFQHVICLPEGADGVPPHGIEDILGQSQVVGVWVNDVDDFADHVGLAWVGLSEIRLGSRLWQVSVEPDFDFPMLIHANQVVFDLKVANSIVQLGEPSEGLVVHVQNVGVGDMVDFT